MEHRSLTSLDFGISYLSSNPAFTILEQSTLGEVMNSEHTFSMCKAEVIIVPKTSNSKIDDEELEYLISLITSKDIKSVTLQLSRKKTLS